MDDMITNFDKLADHIAHLRETFEVLRKNYMKLNSCFFRVESGKFLGFLVSQRGIEANPKKVKVILKMRSPKDCKDI